MRSLRARVLVALFVVVGSFGVALGLNALELARIGGSLELVNEVYLPLAALASRNMRLQCLVQDVHGGLEKACGSAELVWSSGSRTIIHIADAPEFR